MPREGPQFHYGQLTEAHDDLKITMTVAPNMIHLNHGLKEYGPTLTVLASVATRRRARYVLSSAEECPCATRRADTVAVVRAVAEYARLHLSSDASAVVGNRQAVAREHAVQPDSVTVVL